jgi:hypothetical protein
MEPLGGLRDSQSTPSLTVYSKVPPPVFLILRVWVGGLASAAVKLKLKGV